MNLQIVLNAQKTPYLNQGTQKNSCQNFPTQHSPSIIPARGTTPTAHITSGCRVAALFWRKAPR